ncbi:lysosomal thioesterase PPT2 isoform X1 [Piliocolobus tephrosceles]|uniref:lysosomal thioesterase PPT2 isoform X1 n=2 Tax=Piliocolobus tephrosceles TaxID=591936 RepID=UPI000E6B1DE5|nr:lysosomal thioesterase PPT2 isoform X1 [Piliocolobus tephrosceles]
MSQRIPRRPPPLGGWVAYREGSRVGQEKLGQAALSSRGLEDSPRLWRQGHYTHFRMKSCGSMLGLWGQRLPAAWVLLLLSFLPLLLLAAPAPHRASYKPVIVVHGLFDSSYSFRHLLEYINETHPGTVVTVLDLFDGRESLRPLWEQVQGFREAVVPIMAKAPQGVHLICYSQGGLVCRALLSVMDDHNVDSFISLSSPQMGQYGDTDYLKWLFPTSMRSNLYRICYSPWGQEFSICNYWHDPHHDDLYLNASSFLALINGERDHPNATVWRKNFLRVGHLVLIGGPDDGVITPWQSSFFGFYDANETVLEMEEQLPARPTHQSELLLLRLVCLKPPRRKEKPGGNGEREEGRWGENFNGERVGFTQRLRVGMS